MQTQASRGRSRTRGRARPLPPRVHGRAPLRARGARRCWISHRTSSRSPIPNPSPIPNRRGGCEGTHVDQCYLGLRCGVPAHRGPIEQASPAQRQARPKTFGRASRALLRLRRTAVMLRERRRGSAHALHPRPHWTCKASFLTPRRGTGPPAFCFARAHGPWLAQPEPTGTPLRRRALSMRTPRRTDGRAGKTVAAPAQVQRLWRNLPTPATAGTHDLISAAPGPMQRLRLRLRLGRLARFAASTRVAAARRASCYSPR